MVDEDAEERQLVGVDLVLAGRYGPDDLPLVEEEGHLVHVDDGPAVAAEVVVGPLEDELSLGVVGDSDELTAEQTHVTSFRADP